MLHSMSKNEQQKENHLNENIRSTDPQMRTHAGRGCPRNPFGKEDAKLGDGGGSDDTGSAR